MRFNDKELRNYILSAPPQVEGTLTYTDNKEGCKERNVRVINSLLVMYRVSPNRVYTDLQPSELLVLTSCQLHLDPLRPNSFEIIAPGRPFHSTYTFTCKSAAERAHWVSAINKLSLSKLTSDLESLHQQVESKKQALAQSKSLLTSSAASSVPPPPSNKDLLLIDFT
ncbi:uncharacterized protein [Watersipora subatra]|uniref:uncharacterized protein isoform X1 n=1 Tax=Watersipora subatra TaxID=2589382 RepID=UPI00355AFC18